ncbi:hypothetical protein MLD38_017100 [Melastoma candidum]|uniref:Uncharacterized protein n=1 Tax=Melastoma candidum TaxID=119954 RepID=A0ACB9QT18_9MYRT|nr:hypothetical protein MLD38_017100 [Melastoma candidum]
MESPAPKRLLQPPPLSILLLLLRPETFRCRLAAVHSSLPLLPPPVDAPLVEILRDLNKRIPDDVLVPRPDHDHASSPSSLPCDPDKTLLHHKCLLGWCGEVRDVVYCDTGSVTVLYHVTVRGSDGEAHREASGTVSADNGNELGDPVAAAEEIAFRRGNSFLQSVCPVWSWLIPIPRRLEL